MNRSAAEKPPGSVGEAFSAAMRPQKSGFRFSFLTRAHFFPYISYPRNLYLRAEILYCSFGRGAAQLIQCCESPFVGFPFVIKNQPQKACKACACNFFCGYYSDGKNGPNTTSYETRGSWLMTWLDFEASASPLGAATQWASIQHETNNCLVPM